MVWPAVSLAQGRSPRSGERSALAQAASSRLDEIAIEALRGFANTRLGETILLERDGLSLKVNSLAWASTREKLLGKLLLLSPRRDKLAWAKITFLVPCFMHIWQHTKPKQYSVHSYLNPSFIQVYKSHNKSKTTTYDKRTKTLTSLTWKMLAKNFDTQTMEHSSSRNSFESWKIVEQIQNGLPRWILVRLTTIELERKKVRGRINLRDQKITELSELEEGRGPNPSRAFVGNKERSKVLFLASESWEEGLDYFRGLGTLWASL